MPQTGSPAPSDRSGFVSVAETIPDVLLEIRYYSTYNFIGDRVDGYEAPVALLTREAAEALRQVNAAAIAQGYRLKVWDAYRPQQAVAHFVRWAEDVQDTRMKPYFYPALDKAALFERGFIARRSGHSRGSTVDLTLLDMRTGTELDMGGPFDYFGGISLYDAPVTPAQHAHRALLRQLMTDAGFRPLASEWWHFTLRNEPYPETYFTFPVR